MDRRRVSGCSADGLQITSDSAHFAEPQADHGGVGLPHSHTDFGPELEIPDGARECLRQREQLMAVVALVSEAS
jgi:hypothetical protein